jgi:hypothetical protein
MKTLLDDLKDALHAAYARLFPRRVTHNGKAMHHQGARRGRGIGVSAAATVARLSAERALRAECERMATLLSGVRAGRRDTMRTRIALARLKAVQRVPARARFAAATAVGHVRTAARETAAAAADTARQVGAHRHVRGVNDAAHNLAASALASLKAHEHTRAAGERPWWQQGMRTA